MFTDDHCPSEIRDTLYYLRQLHQRMAEPYTEWERDHRWSADRAADADQDAFHTQWTPEDLPA